MTDPQNLELIPDNIFKRKIFLSLVVPVSLTIVLWLILFIESEFALDFTRLGIYPNELRGLPGIVLSPLIHSDARHLFNNTLPLLILGSALFYFYSDVAFRVFGISWIASGLLVWLGGRPAWHIGASGIIYGLAAFLFLSGLIRRYFRLMALSMLVVFLYGSMVWGMFPILSQEISWESHMLGAFTGLILAIWFRNDGPVRPVPEWMLIEDEEDEEAPDDLSEDQAGENKFK